MLLSSFTTFSLIPPFMYSPSCSQISELDMIAHRTLDAGVDLESDHPGFHDQTYRDRRAELAQNALQHRCDKPIPHIEYSKEEIETWGAVWDRMEDLWKKYACKEYLVSGG